MNKRFRAAFVALVAVVLWIAAPAAAAPTFPPLTGRVVDDAHLLSDSAKADLTAKLDDLEKRTTRQLVVVTLPSLQGYEIEDYGYQLGRKWGIGQKKENNGVLFIIAPNERATRIEVGYGLEGILTDALSSVILQSRVLPQFKKGNMEGGIVAGTDAIVEQLTLDAPAAKARVAAAAEQQNKLPHINPLVVLFVLFFVFSIFGRIFRGMRGGGLGRRGSNWWLIPLILMSSGRGGRGDGGGWGGGSGGGWGGGGGGSFGGGGSSGRW